SLAQHSVSFSELRLRSSLLRYFRLTLQTRASPCRIPPSSSFADRFCNSQRKTFAFTVWLESPANAFVDRHVPQRPGSQSSDLLRNSPLLLYKNRTSTTESVRVRCAAFFRLSSASDIFAQRLDFVFPDDRAVPDFL